MVTRAMPQPIQDIQSIARITAVKPSGSTSTSLLQKAMKVGLISWIGQKPNLPPPVKLLG